MRGYFAVGVCNPKTEANVGTLLRSAWTFDAACVATVGRQRYQHQATDTARTPRHVPLFHFDGIDDLVTHLPAGCELVGVELDPRATPMHEFRHPERAFYLLGAEDRGLPVEVLDRCDRVVQIATPRTASLNVATAGTVLLADRYAKGVRRVGAA